LGSSNALFPNSSDVTLVCCPDGADEIPAHQIILSGSTSAVFGLRQQHPDGRLETEMIDAGCNQSVVVARAVHRRDPAYYKMIRLLLAYWKQPINFS
jgi:hypothetical protein